MQGIALVLAVAVLVEGLTEYIKEFVTSEGEVKVANIISLVSSIGLALIFQAQLFTSLGIEVAHPIVDMVLTGVVLSRGSNYVHDLITRLGGGRSNPKEVTTKTEGIDLNQFDPDFDGFDNNKTL